MKWTKLAHCEHPHPVRCDVALGVQPCHETDRTDGCKWPKGGPYLRYPHIVWKSNAEVRHCMQRMKYIGRLHKK